MRQLLKKNLHFLIINYEPIIRSVLAGICEALIEKKTEYTPFTNKWKFSLELFAITSFSELLVNPFTRVIDLEKIPQDIRGRMYGNLNRFGDGIHTLKLGSGSGGMVPEAYSETFIKGNGLIAV